MKFFQRLGRSMMLPVAVLPVAAILSGLGYWIISATGNENNIAAVFLAAAGGALLDNMALLFAIGISIGMATRTDGTSALAGLASWLTVTTLLKPETVAKFQGIDPEAVNPAFGAVNNVFVGILCGLIGAFAYDRFKDTKLPDALSFFSGKRSVAIVAAGISLVLALVLLFVWPLVYSGLVAFGEFIVTLGPLGAGLYGFLNRLLIPLGLHHPLNSVFWFDVAGINDLNNFLGGTGERGVTGQYMTGFFPVMMFGLPGAALAMYTTAKTNRRKAAAGILLSAAFASFFVGVTEPLEFAFMFLAPALYVVHALFMGISLAVSAMLPVRMGFGFSGGFIDLVLNWVNPMAVNPWLIPVMGIFWFAVYFFVFRWMILRFDLKTPGRDDAPLTDVASDPGDRRSNTAYDRTAAAFLTGLGGAENILDLENCATRLRMEIADPSQVDDEALRHAGAAGVIRPGGKSVQVVYGLNVQFVKDAMERIMENPELAPASDAAPAEGVGEPAAGASASSAAADGAGAEGRVARIAAPIPGRVVPLSEVPDATFADGLMGPGVAIEPTSGVVTAPADGTVSAVFPTSHAIALSLDSGEDILIHVGLDTVKMQGEGMRTLVEQGQRVSAGQQLLDVDLEAVRRAGYPTITPVVMLNDPSGRVEII